MNRLIRNAKLFCITSIASLLTIFLASQVFAYPSGGPYGPVNTSYALPEVSGSIYYVAPDGQTDNKGTDLNKPTTLNSAIQRVVTGDAIVMRGGVYRTGDLELNQQVIIQAYKDENPIIKGTYVAKDWTDYVPEKYRKHYSGLWGIKWEHLFPSAPDSWWVAERSGRKTPLHKFNNDMVFVNGRYLQSAAWLNDVDENSFYIDYDKKIVYIGVDPTDKTVEITAFNQGLIVTPREVNGKKADGKGPIIRGITLSQFAFHAFDVEGFFPEGKSNEKDHGKDVVGTTIENCTISYGGRVGAFVFGDKFTMRNCKISDTSTEGLFLLSSSDALLEKNIFTRNNIEGITGYFPAAVKIFNQTHRITCNDNLVIDHPDSNGIWYDVGNEDGVFTNNWLENIGNRQREFTGEAVWPSRNAFFFEISKRATVAGNVFVNNDQGILVLNSSGVKVFNNTFYNSMAAFGRDSRGADKDHFGWHVTTGPDVDKRVDHAFVNNLLVGDQNHNRPLLYVWQAPELCKQLKQPALDELNHNAYVRQGDTKSPDVWISQRNKRECITTFSSPKDLQKAFKNYADKSLMRHNYSGSVFQSAALKNFEPLQPELFNANAAAIPATIKSLIKADNRLFIGAYPEN